MKIKKPVITVPLPKPVIASDLLTPEYDAWARESYDAPHYTASGGWIEFELWYTERFGWCIPTLQIKGLSGRARSSGIQTRRSYAVTLGRERTATASNVEAGQLLCIGHGPHVKATYHVYVKATRLAALKPLLDVMLTGAEKAGECRDRISTRRANTRMRRSAYDSWMS